MRKSKTNFPLGLTLLGIGGLLSNINAAETPAGGSGPAAGQKPAWLTDLSLGIREGYDDNVLLVSGEGMKPQASWITTVSPKIGFNFLPLLGKQTTLQTLSLSYAPDFSIYHDTPEESVNAHKVASAIKGKNDDFSYGLDNSFLYDDGSSVAETYALNQLSGPAANQNDKYRNFYSQGVPRERRNQFQDRAALMFQYDWDKFFVRPAAALIYYGLNTDFHNTSTPNYKGYQNYPDRYDVNGGLDLGCRMTSSLAVTVGYRHGYQYQQQFEPAINADSHFSSSDYERLLLGLEGKPWSWLTVKLAGGPDFREYNQLAPVNDLNLMTYYSEGSLTATISPRQSVAFNYKQWQWVSSTGIVPYFDSTFALTYHWTATKKLGFDLGGKVLEADFTSGNEVTGSATSRRDDRQYTLSLGTTYAFDPHFSVSLTWNYDLGKNVQGGLPASLQPAYRDFDHQLVALGMQYKF